MKKYLLFIITFIFALTKSYTQQIIKGTDSFKHEKIGEKEILKYKLFKLVMMPSGEWNGYSIKLYNKDNKVIKTIEGFFFMGMIENRFALFDEGTSQSRSVSVFDTKSLEFVLEDGYYDNLELINGELQYYDSVDLNDETKKPKCPEELLKFKENIGYAEKHIFNFKTQSLKETGEYICIFLE